MQAYCLQYAVIIFKISFCLLVPCRIQVTLKANMFYLIAFDISDDKVRYRAVKALKGYGIRVQKSVFECSDLTEKQFLGLKDRLEALIDEATDSVRYYRLCRKCLKDVELSGMGELPHGEKFGIV